MNIYETLSSTTVWVIMTIEAVLMIFFGAIIFFVFTEVFGVQSKIENVLSHYNRALSAWCAFATREGMDRAYPVAIEIDAERAPFGIIVKKVFVLVKRGFREVRYELVRADEHFVEFKREEEGE